MFQIRYAATNAKSMGTALPHVEEVSLVLIAAKSPMSLRTALRQKNTVSTVRAPTLPLPNCVQFGRQSGTSIKFVTLKTSPTERQRNYLLPLLQLPSQAKHILQQ